MLNFLYQLVSNCVCLLLAAGQVVYSGFIRAYRMHAADEEGADESSETESKNGSCGPGIYKFA